MIDFLCYLPAKRKANNSGWITFNAPCCVHNGENTDTRHRGGFKVRDQEGWSFHCFNCGFTASFTVGRNLGFKAKRFLQWLGVDDIEISRINLESMRLKSMQDVLNDRTPIRDKLPSFVEINLPKHIVALSNSDDATQTYVTSRHLPADYPLMQHVTDTGRKGVLVPFTHNHAMVGYTTRFLDNKLPKYIQNIQPGYVFGMDLQQRDWVYIIAVEGVFDALSIDGVALLHNDVNAGQATLIKNANKKVIVVPDQDAAGIALIDRAIELGWGVSIPDWGDGIKDVNDAVAKFGKLSTLISIIENVNFSKIKIELSKKTLRRKVT